MLRGSRADPAVTNASAATIKQRKRKALVIPPFMWSKFAGMEQCFAELIREDADRLLTHTSDTTSIYEDMGKHLEACYHPNVFFGLLGIKRLRQKYKNLRKSTNAFVSHRKTSGNARYTFPRVHVQASRLRESYSVAIIPVLPWYHCFVV